MNKLQNVSEICTSVDCMYTGVTVQITFLQDGAPVHYSIIGNPRILEVSKGDVSWDMKTIIDRNIVLDPRNVSDAERDFFTTMYFELNVFDKALLDISSEIITMWSNEASDLYIKAHLDRRMMEFLEIGN